MHGQQNIKFITVHHIDDRFSG